MQHTLLETTTTGRFSSGRLRQDKRYPGRHKPGANAREHMACVNSGDRTKCRRGPASVLSGTAAILDGAALGIIRHRYAWVPGLTKRPPFLKVSINQNQGMH